MWTINAQHHHSTYKRQFRFRYNVTIIRLFTWESRYKITFYVSFCCSFSTCLFKPTIIFGYGTITQRNRQPARRADAPVSWNVDVENLVTLRSTWTDLAVCGTIITCCDNLFLTYRNRAHFLCPWCVEYTYNSHNIALTHRKSRNVLRFMPWLVLVDFLNNFIVVDEKYSNTKPRTFRITGVSSYVYPLVARVKSRMTVTLHPC